MKKPRTKITTAREYVRFVKQFVTLADQEFTRCEELLKQPQDIQYAVDVMPKLIALADTIACLRGELFTELRPHVLPQYQKEFYAYEDSFEERLKNIVKVIEASEQKHYYREEVARYYTARVSFLSLEK